MGNKKDLVIASIEYKKLDILELLEAHKAGDKTALNLCVIGCYQLKVPLPEWALAALAKRADIENTKDVSLVLKKQRENINVYTVMFALLGRNLTDTDRNVIVAQMLNLYGAKTKMGKEYTPENLQKIMDDYEVKNHSFAFNKDLFLWARAALQGIPLDATANTIANILHKTTADEIHARVLDRLNKTKP